jgi:hypothetical protein
METTSASKIVAEVWAWAADAVEDALLQSDPAEWDSGAYQTARDLIAELRRTEEAEDD